MFDALLQPSTVGTAVKVNQRLLLTTHTEFNRACFASVALICSPAETVAFRRNAT